MRRIFSYMCMPLLAACICCCAGDRSVTSVDFTQGPPMGWNSYDSYGIYIYDEAARLNARKMAEILKPSGYEYFVLDAGWFIEFDCFPGTHVPDTRNVKILNFDQYGVLQPSRNGFPEGFKALVDEVHALGLKFGLHLMRGVPRQAVEADTAIKGTPYHASDIADLADTCSWSSQNYGVDMTKPGAQEYYNSVAAQLAEWEVDFVKYDDIVPHPDEVEAVVKAFAECGRYIVLSLSPGNHVDMDAVGTFAKAEMLRVTGDVWDEQKDIDKCFKAWKLWQNVSVDGLWLDMDMIPFGQLQLLSPDPETLPGKPALKFCGRGNNRWCQLSHDQMTTFITMRALSASPLMVGGDLLTMDEFSLGLLTDPDMIACDQNGAMGKLQYEKDGLEIWRTELASNGGESGHCQSASWCGEGCARKCGIVNGGWIGIFNRTTEPITGLTLTPEMLGLDNKVRKVRDIWNDKTLRLSNPVNIAPNGVLFLKY